MLRINNRIFLKTSKIIYKLVTIKASIKTYSSLSEKEKLREDLSTKHFSKSFPIRDFNVF